MLIPDPQATAIESIAGETAVEAHRLNLDWIKARFMAPPVWQPEITDEHPYVAAHQCQPAAVLIVLAQREQGLNVLLTRRTTHLSHHAGQISFPGGRHEAQDSDAIATALREAQEEIGLDRSKVAILGQLPQHNTVTGYRITPVVAAVSTLPELIKDSHEVAEIFEVPLNFLMNGAMHQRRSVIWQNTKHQTLKRTFYAMPYQDYFIWGATAAILRNLFHFLRAS
jgi:8-oxo-dGTP pyrophosphatase MutT (NUDIX family)